ncbi:hypothetical protein MMC31_005475 [Peltigera leucophlebia]|nr:hypothetical protein [Peltigera leucophlebia]
MDVERSLEAQQSLGDVYEAPIKRLNDRILGTYNDENELAKIEKKKLLKVKAQVPDFDKYPKPNGTLPVSTSSWTAFVPRPLLPQLPLKKRRTTGDIWGLANAIRADIKLENNIYTVVDICSPESHPHDFCKHGDSGSVVIDKQGRLCRLLIGGTERDFGQGADFEHGFVIPIDIVFDDIESVTGLKVSLP